MLLQSFFQGTQRAPNETQRQYVEQLHGLKLALHRAPKLIADLSMGARSMDDAAAEHNLWTNDKIQVAFSPLQTRLSKHFRAKQEVSACTGSWCRCLRTDTE